MRRSRSFMILALVLVTGAGCSPMDDALAAIFGRSMRSQASVGTYEDPRLPAEGSVSFSSGNFYMHGEIAADQAEAGVMPPPITPLQLLQGHPDAVGLENPVPPTAESLERGEELFLRSCAPCHGPEGAGDGPITEAGMPAFTLLEGQALEHSESYIYSIIRVGRGSMPAYGHQITHFDRWHIVNYVRQLQGIAPEQAGQDAGSPGEEGGEG